jgi:hypothetical protein
VKKTGTHQLESVMESLAPRLDFILNEGPLNVQQHMGPFKELPPEMKRRGGICSATSWLLAGILRKEGIYASPVSRVSSIRHRGIEYKSYHVLLETSTHDNRYIDPTYQQFFKYAGLYPELVIENPELAELYPENGIAIIDPTSTEFQEAFAEDAHMIERSLARRGFKNEQILADSTSEEKSNFYRQVWDVTKYKRMFAPNRDLMRAVSQSTMLVDRHELLK